MNEFQIALLIGAVLTSLVSFRLPRAHLWILAGAVSFVASTAYARYGLPFPPAFTLSCDAAVCLLIYFFCRERWEERIFRIFQLSVLVSLVFLAGPISIGSLTITMSHYVYIVMLELCNWAALSVIGGTAILDWVGEHEGGFGHGRHRHIRMSRISGRTARVSVPFHKVR